MLISAAWTVYVCSEVRGKGVRCSIYYLCVGGRVLDMSVRYEVRSIREIIIKGDMST